MKDLSGEPLIGASIVEKGTANGTITDINGAFTLNIKENATIEVFYLGYKPQEIVAGQTVEFAIVMEDETKRSPQNSRAGRQSLQDDYE